MRRLLLLSCSERKLPDPGLLPAIKRYDGPIFRVLRRFLRERSVEMLDVYILSARFGLLPSYQAIPYYDECMTRQRARELRPEVLAQLGRIFKMANYQEALVCLGRDYWLALEGYEAVIPRGLDICVAFGPMGRRQAQVHEWLWYGRTWG